MADGGQVHRRSSVELAGRVLGPASRSAVAMGTQTSPSGCSPLLRKGPVNPTGVCATPMKILDVAETVELRAGLARDEGAARRGGPAVQSFTPPRRMLFRAPEAPAV